MAALLLDIEFVQLLRIFFAVRNYKARRDLRAIAFSPGAKPIRQTSRLLFCIADDSAAPHIHKQAPGRVCSQTQEEPLTHSSRLSWQLRE